MRLILADRDLRKSLRLLWKSNPPLLERIQSPIIYKADKEFMTGINRVAQKTYSRIATIHHYLSMAKKAFEEVVNAEEYKLKNSFMHLVHLFMFMDFRKGRNSTN